MTPRPKPSLHRRLWARLFARWRNETGTEKIITRMAMKTPAKLILGGRKIKKQ